ncbi:hypothetical protein V6N13_074864 [Hibiscus sabdariffa]
MKREINPIIFPIEALEAKIIKIKGKEKQSSRVRRSDLKRESVSGTNNCSRTDCEISDPIRLLYSARKIEQASKVTRFAL